MMHLGIGWSTKMRATGKSFRNILLALYTASEQTGHDVIVWAANEYECNRLAKSLKDMALIYLSGVKVHRTFMQLPNGTKIYVKNMKEVEKETRGWQLQNYNEIIDEPTDDDETITRFHNYRFQRGILNEK